MLSLWYKKMISVLIAGSAMQFCRVMCSRSHYWQSCKLCLHCFFTPDVRPSPQPLCWQWQDPQAFSPASNRTALSSLREIFFLCVKNSYVSMGFVIVSTQFHVTIATDCGELNVGSDMSFSSMWAPKEVWGKAGEVTSMKVYVTNEETSCWILSGCFTST